MYKFFNCLLVLKQMFEITDGMFFLNRIRCTDETTVFVECRKACLNN